MVPWGLEGLLLNGLQVLLNVLVAGSLMGVLLNDFVLRARDGAHFNSLVSEGYS